MEADQDVIALLAMIKKMMCGVEESLQKKMAKVMYKNTLHTFLQNNNVANDDYKSQLDAYITVLEAHADRITVPPTLLGGKIKELYPSFRDPKNELSHQFEAATEAVKER